MAFLVVLINTAVQVITLLVIINALLSFILPQYHSLRQMLDRLVEPLLAPIRRILPQTGPLDFSPLVLILVLQLVGQLLVGILRTLY